MGCTPLHAGLIPRPGGTPAMPYRWYLASAGPIARTQIEPAPAVGDDTAGRSIAGSRGLPGQREAQSSHEGVTTPSNQFFLSLEDV